MQIPSALNVKFVTVFQNAAKDGFDELGRYMQRLGVRPTFCKQFRFARWIHEGQLKRSFRGK